ncbi:MAG: Gar1/Naf1 family protein [Euryarchaeota archaeon]|nr:Gar1/Naf1 family protein [Euryarchaeota archaeon]
MQRVGKILHLSNRGNLIARSEITPKIGAIVVTKDKEKIGLIFEAFGPKEKPYLAIKPTEKLLRVQLEKFVDKDIYLLPKSKFKK